MRDDANIRQNSQTYKQFSCLAPENNVLFDSKEKELHTLTIRLACEVLYVYVCWPLGLMYVQKRVTKETARRCGESLDSSGEDVVQFRRNRSLGQRRLMPVRDFGVVVVAISRAPYLAYPRLRHIRQQSPHRASFLSSLPSSQCRARCHIRL